MVVGPQGQREAEQEVAFLKPACASVDSGGLNAAEGGERGGKAGGGGGGGLEQMGLKFMEGGGGEEVGIGREDGQGSAKTASTSSLLNVVKQLRGEKARVVKALGEAEVALNEAVRRDDVLLEAEANPVWSGQRGGSGGTMRKLAAANSLPLNMPSNPFQLIMSHT